MAILPPLDYDSLMSMKLPKSKEIGYATTVDKFVPRSYRTVNVFVYHHIYHIATIAPGFIMLDSCGRTSRTTSDRLDSIARDNNLGRVENDNGNIRLFPQDGSKPVDLSSQKYFFRSPGQEWKRG